MVEFSKVQLGTGPGTTPRDTHYQAHAKHNANWDALEEILNTPTTTVTGLNNQSGAVSIIGDGPLNVSSGQGKINIALDDAKFNAEVAATSSYQDINTRLAALEGVGTAQTTWNLSTAKQGAGDATTAVTLSGDSATATINTSASGNNFVRVLGTKAVASTDAIYVVFQPTGGAGSDFGFGFTTADATFNGVFLDNLTNSGGNVSLAIRITDNKVNVNGVNIAYTNTGEEMYDFDPAVDGTSWLVYIDRAHGKGFIRPVNYPLNFSSSANAQSGVGAFDLPVGWGTAAVYPFASWVFPAVSTPVTVKLVNSAATIASLFPNASFTGYKVLGSSSQTGTGTTTEAPSANDPTGGKTASWNSNAGAISEGQAKSGSVTALRAADYTDAYGVNTHFTNPEFYEDLQGSYNMMVTAKVSAIRDSMANVDDWIAWMTNAIVANPGMKINLLTGINDGNTVDNYIVILKKIGVANLCGIEGTNEWETSYNYQTVYGSNLPQAIFNFQKELYTKIRADSAFDGIPVVQTSQIDVGQNWKIAGVAPYADVGNYHSYTGGVPISIQGDTGSYIDADGQKYYYGALLWGAKLCCNALAPNKPRWATETGFNTDSTGQDDGNHPLPNLTTHAKYYSYHIFYHFIRGYARTFFYELRDSAKTRTGNEAHFGIFNSDGTPKPCVTPLVNNKTLLTDTGSTARTFTPTAVAMVLGGDFGVKSNQSTVATLEGLNGGLLQDSQGRFYYGWFDDAPLYNVNTKADVSEPATKTGTVTFTGKTISNLVFADSMSDASWRTPTASTECSASGAVLTVKSACRLRWARFNLT